MIFKSKAALPAILLFALFSCKKDISTSPSAPSSADDASVTATGHFIGEHFGGGVVFYIENPLNGKHGLIADTTDLSRKVTWVGWDKIVTNATGKRIGTGYSNTNTIIDSQGTRDKNYAAYLCKQDTSGGYHDWFMPSLGELAEMYKYKDLIGGFADTWYWSSTEYNYSFAYILQFGTGDAGYTDKSNGNFGFFYLRAIRAF